MRMLRRAAMVVMVAMALVALVPATAGLEAVKNRYPRAKEIPLEQVVWMYTMKTRLWADGSKVTVIYRDASATHSYFCTTVLGITTTRFQQLVSAYVNNGNASYFKKVDSEDSMIAAISMIEGSIGYLDSETVIVNRGNNNVEILRITR